MRKAILLLTLIFLNYACSSNKANSSNDSYYYKCMKKYSQENGVGFYSELEKFKSDLLSNGLIQDKSKDSYVKALQQIYKHNNKWNLFYNENKEKSYFSSVKDCITYFFLKCSFLNWRSKSLDSIEPSLLTIQRLNYYQLSTKPLDSDEIIPNIIFATDVHKKTDDLNLMLLLLLYLDASFNPDTSFSYIHNDK